MERKKTKIGEPKVIRCTKFCDWGHRGMDNCNACDCTGQMLAVIDHTTGGLKTFPNTEQGYKDAKVWLKSR